MSEITENENSTASIVYISCIIEDVRAFNALFGYLGQQYLLYRREEFLRDEFTQWINSNDKLDQILRNFVEVKFLTSTDGRIYRITEAMQKQAEAMEEEVFRSGSLSGGEIEIMQDRQMHTVLVHFETNRKIFEEIKIAYGNYELFFSCHPEKGYFVKAFSKEEVDLAANEEAIYRYLSHSCYHDDLPIYVKAVHHASHDFRTRPVVINLPKGAPLKLSRLDLLNEQQARALSFFRQFKNFSAIDSSESRYYQLLSLIKIIEGVKPGSERSDVEALLIKYLPKITMVGMSDIDRVVTGFSKYVGKALKTGKIEEIIWECRNGVGHWRKPGTYFVDPDVPDPHIETIVRILTEVVRMVLVDEYSLRPYSPKR